MNKINKRLSTNTLLNTILILLTAFSLISCSNDGDTSADTFLERFHNTIWKYTYVQDTGNGNVNEDNYLRFNNNISNPIYVWEFYSYQSDCWEYYNYASRNIEVLENSRDTFILNVTYSDETSEVYTFNLVGDSMVVNTITKDGPNTFNTTVSFHKTSDNVNNLKICN